MGRAHLAAACVLAAVASLASPASGANPGLPAEFDPRCHLWVPTIETLNVAVRDHSCVQLPPGRYALPKQVNIPWHRTILGWSRDDTVLEAAPGFQGTGAFATNGAQGVRVAHLTVDLAGRAVGGLGATGMTIEHVRVTGARCWGIGVAGPKMVVRDSIVERNGATCPVAPPGAGVYVVGTHYRDVKPVFERNLIRNNAGPGVDVNLGWGGRFVGNTVSGNAGWAALSLYGASNWTVADNKISHPTRPSGRRVRPYHAFCDPGYYQRGPRGWGTAAVLLCHDGQTHITTGNVLSRNRLVSTYGVLSIGSDDVGMASRRRVATWQVPRRNTFRDNVMKGSAYGCADDLRPGQRDVDRNTWRGNDCRGRAGTGPGYF